MATHIRKAFLSLSGAPCYFHDIKERSFHPDSVCVGIRGNEFRPVNACLAPDEEHQQIALKTLYKVRCQAKDMVSWLQPAARMASCSFNPIRLLYKEQLTFLKEESFWVLFGTNRAPKLVTVT